MPTNPQIETEIGRAEIAKGLTAAQRARLLEWPHTGSTFRGEPDAVAVELCKLGVGVMMRWKYGRQMGLRPLGLAVRRIIEERAT